MSVEHLTLLLFLFHHLSESQRKTLVVEICQCLIRIHARIKDKTTTYSPLLISRLLVLLDYILYQFDEPSPVLLHLIENSLLNINSKLKSSNDQNLKSTSNISFSIDNAMPLYPAIDSIEKFYIKFKTFQTNLKFKPQENVSTKSSLLVKPCFYSLKTTDLSLLIDNATRASKFRLDFSLIESTRIDMLNFGTLPVSKQFLSKVLNEIFVTLTNEKDQELKTVGAENNYELIQVLRVAFSSNGGASSDLNSKFSLSSIFGKKII